MVLFLLPQRTVRKVIDPHGGNRSREHGRPSNHYSAPQIFFAIVATFLLIVRATHLEAATATAQWNPNPEPNIAGYVLSYGLQSGNYTTTIDVGNVTTYSLTLTAGQTYYFALQAYNTAGLFSPYSAEVVHTVSAGPPTIISLSPTSGSAGTAVTISGSNFGATQGTSSVAFNGTTAAPQTWSDTSVVAPVPAGASSGPVVITAGGVASNGVTFTVTTIAPAPVITSVTPASGPAGTTVTLAGSNFGATQGTSTVTFNGTAATATAWSATSVTVAVPTGATTGPVIVTVNGQASNGVTFTVTTTAPAPVISSLAPTSGPVGATVTIAGSNFGATQGTSTVTFNGTAATATAWSAASVTVAVPTGATTGPVIVTVNGQASNGANFTVTSSTGTTPTFVQLNYATPQSPTTTINVPFTKAQSAGDLNVVVVGWNDDVRAVQSVTDTAGNVYALAVGPTVLPSQATQSIYNASNIAAAAAGTNTVTVTFTGAAVFPDIRITEYSGIDQVAPLDVATGASNSSTTAANSGNVTTTSAAELLFGASLVKGGTTAAGSGFTVRVITSPDSDLVEDRVVSAAGTYSASSSVSPDGWIMQLVAFRAATATTPPPAPAITSVSPSSGSVGTIVTIAGNNFGASQGTSTVTFNGTAAAASVWSATSLMVGVPTGATSGPVVVTVGGQVSNAVTFIVNTPAPAITTLTPTSGPVGATVTIAGSNFGATQGTSTVTFNGTAATVSAWSATSLSVKVPTAATSGPVLVTVGSQASNGVIFTVTASSDLPSPWLAEDVGSAGLQGSASYSSGVFTVTGAGSDIGGSADSFQFVHQSLAGDGEIVVRVTSEQFTDPGAKAGVMFRSTMTADSADVTLDVEPGGQIDFMSRAAAGASTSSIAGATASIPVWLKLTRAGNAISGYGSTDGTNWTLVGQTAVALGSSVETGLAVTSHTTTALNTSTFDNVSVTSSGVTPLPPDVVVYASDVPAGNVHGTWSTISDATAAAGVALVTSNSGYTQTAGALVAPIDYVDVPFNAQAGVPYTFWIRLRALNNSKYNDSIWVQFSGALVGSSAAYPIGTTSGLLVNLATSSLRPRGWGWTNEAYWLSQAATVTFATSGPQVVRIQVREDGVQFDQIVLSPDTYLNSAPGAASKDATIVPKN